MPVCVEITQASTSGFLRKAQMLTCQGGLGHWVSEMDEGGDTQKLNPWPQPQAPSHWPRPPGVAAVYVLPAALSPCFRREGKHTTPRGGTNTVCPGFIRVVLL